MHMPGLAIALTDLTVCFPTGEAASLIPLDGSLCRIDADAFATPALRFGAVAAGRALVVEYANCPNYHACTP